MVRKARIPILQIACLSLVAPDASACQVCQREMMHYAMPWLFPVLIVFAVWRIAYGVWQIRSRPTGLTTKRLIIRLIERIAIVAVLLFLFLDAGLVLYFMAGYIKALVVVFKRYRAASKLGAGVKDLWRPFAFPVVLHVLAIAIAIPIMSAFWSDFAKQDDLGRLQRYVTGGGPVERQLANRIAHDPQFDVQRLRPMILSSSWNDHTKAFHVLWRRSKADDLVALWDALANHPSLEPSLRSDYTSGNCHFELRSWMNNLGVPDTVITSQGLRQWIDTRAANVVTTGDTGDTGKRPPASSP